MPDPIALARRAVLDFALSLPYAYEDHPWGETVAKVGKKVFAFLGVDRPDGSMRVCVKLPVSGPAALETAFVEPAGYGLGKSGWVYAKFEPGDRPPTPLLLAWIQESYRAVAPKTLLKRLDAAAARAAAAGAAPAGPSPSGPAPADPLLPAAKRRAAKRRPAPARRRRPPRRR